MAYFCTLNLGQNLYLDNDQHNTIVTLTHSLGETSPTRQILPTGTWQLPPEVWKTRQGIIIKLTTVQQRYFLLIQGNWVHLLSSPLNLNNALRLPLLNPDQPTDPAPNCFTQAQC
ncbi:hypothetical protein [Alkalinema sp. FACHB-956]|uniref:hypothetical protein n=1 Tax=Alkalinema sp. FACHB-956 TaxID=2692768 RepID=UPI0016864C07|nr:hypothetical protein [Alkalinema sp. FACHB-956]MBD2325664.1 hypothetical protein [Alkalinema sp. FACHB-956]